MTRGVPDVLARLFWFPSSTSEYACFAMSVPATRGQATSPCGLVPRSILATFSSSDCLILFAPNTHSYTLQVFRHTCLLIY